MRAAIAFASVLCLCGVQAISQQARTQFEDLEVSEARRFETCAELFERVTRLIVFRALQVFYSDRPFPPEVLVAEAVAKAEARTIERCLSVAEPRTIAYVECRARDRLGFASLIMWKR